MKIVWSAWLLLFASWVAQAGYNPVINGISPTSGGPGTVVTINGSDFLPLVAVYFGTDQTSSAQILTYSANQITAIVPAAAVTSRVTVLSYRAAVSPQTFYVPPTVDSFDPPSGLVGTTVVISGHGFADPNFLTSVYFNGVKATSGQVVSDTQITVRVPLGASSGYITMTNSIGSAVSASYFYLNPIVTGFTNRAFTGQTINLSGVSFLGVTSVSLSGVPVTFSVPNGTNIQLTVPQNASDGPFLVTSPGGSYLTTSNLLILPNITSFYPPGGPAGTVVTILGTGLSATSRVLFGSLASQAITNVNSTTVTAVVPSGVPTAPVTLITANGTNISSIPFYAAPALDSFSPSSGIVGTLITLQGRNFTGASLVTLGGVSLPGFQVLSSSQIQVAAPSTPGSGTFQVVTPGGVATSTAQFTVLGPQPSITSFSPANGPVGTLVSLYGNNLTSATAVTMGGINAAFQWIAGNLVATVPTGARTSPFTVITPSGSATSSLAFTVGSTADVRLVMSSSINPAIANAPLNFNFQVNNAGPLTAGELVVTVTLPLGVTFVGASGTPNFDHVGNSVFYRYGDLGSGGLVNGGLTLRTGTTTNLTVTAVATSSTTIPSGGRNASSVTVPVLLPSLSFILIDPGTLLLQWPSPASTYQLENSLLLFPSEWTTVTNSPSDDGVTKELLLPMSGASKVFRLHNPTAP